MRRRDEIEEALKAIRYQEKPLPEAFLNVNDTRRMHVPAETLIADWASMSLERRVTFTALLLGRERDSEGPEAVIGKAYEHLCRYGNFDR